jgi:hypothetical protein
VPCSKWFSRRTGPASRALDRHVHRPPEGIDSVPRIRLHRCPHFHFVTVASLSAAHRESATRPVQRGRLQESEAAAAGEPGITVFLCHIDHQVAIRASR